MSEESKNNSLLSHTQRKVCAFSIHLLTMWMCHLIQLRPTLDWCLAISFSLAFSMHYSLFLDQCRPSFVRSCYHSLGSTDSTWIWKITRRKCHFAGTFFYNFTHTHTQFLSTWSVTHVMDGQMHDKDKNRGQKGCNCGAKGGDRDGGGDIKWDIWVWYFHGRTLVSSSSFLPPRDRIR